MEYCALAIDDAPEVLQAIRAALGESVKVLAATTAEKGLQLASEQKPDIILLDVMMEWMDGYALCRTLKQDPHTADIPVIFVTGLDSEGSELRGFEAGAVDFVAKPLQPVILRARVETHVELARTRKRLQQVNNQLARERLLIDGIVDGMRQTHPFCARNVSYTSHSGDMSSGDLLMSACLPNGRQHLLLGDFTGHGLQAAIGTPLVAHVFYSLCAKGMPIERLLDEVNKVLVQQLPVHVFMAAAVIELDETRARVWNFGGPDLLLNDHLGQWQRLASQELPLGIELRDQAYSYREIDLNAGQSLYVFTDGFNEAPLAEGGMLGVSRLIEQLEMLEGDVQGLMKHLLAQTDPLAELDDMTMLKVCLQGCDELASVCRSCKKTVNLCATRS